MRNFKSANPSFLCSFSGVSECGSEMPGEFCFFWTSGRIAGSLLGFSEGLKHLRALHLLPDSELIRCTGYNQARSLGIPEIGELKAGAFADFVIAEDDWTPRAVWCDGKLQYEKTL